MNNLICVSESLDWDRSKDRVYIRGYALIEGINIEKDYKVKKSLYIDNGKKKFIMPVQNQLRLDITKKYGKDGSNYNYAGFEGFIDLSCIDNMHPLSEGKWNVGIYINADGIEMEGSLRYIKKRKGLVHIIPKEMKSSKINNIKKIDLQLEDEELVIKSTNEKVSFGKYIVTSFLNSKFVDKFKKKLLKGKRAFGNFVLRSIYRILKLQKVKDNRVVFLSDSRVDFTGNFEFVYNELKSRGGYDIKYMLKPSIDAKRSLKEMITFVQYISTSKYILLDDYYPQIYKYKIKKDVEVIQLWHATGAFKTFGFSRIGKKGGPKVKSKNHRNYTKAIVSSEDIRIHYAEAFGISEEKVVATGVPRTDIFFDENYKNKKLSEIYSKYPMLKDKKVIMFAPTFRGNGQKTATYDFEEFDVKRLKEKLGDEYIIISKLHPFIKEKMYIPKDCKNFIIDLSKEREINDLLFVADILITDYSSVCFEYSLLNKPMIFFAYDLEDYIASRDFYYPYETFVPGPIARSTDDIINIVLNKKFETEKLEKFRKTFFDHFDGKSTQRVVDTLLKIEK